MTNFWRRAAINDQKEPKPQSERNPEWLTDYQKNNLGSQQKTSNGKQKVLSKERGRVGKAGCFRVLEGGGDSVSQLRARGGGGGRTRQQQREEEEQSRAVGAESE